MTRRLKSSWADSVTLSTASNVRSMRWRLFARIATAVSSATAWKRREKSFAVSTAHALPAQLNSRTAFRVGRVTPCARFQVYERAAGTAPASSRLRFNPCS